VKVSSNRGFIKAVAVGHQTPAHAAGRRKPVHTVGIPIHWGFTGLAKPGFLANTLYAVVRRRQFADALSSSPSSSRWKKL